MTPRRTRVKICGLTRADDAHAAVRLGADAIGFVLWFGSPRHVAAADVAAVTAGLPRLVSRVGVSVDAAPGAVRDAVREAGLDAVQLHGAEAIEQYRAVGAPLIKAVTLETDADLERALALPTDVTLLVDAVDGTRHGGTGRTANWARAARLAAERPILLAGGLTPDNVAEAIAAVQPWGVDVSSGVEDTPGVKSLDRLERFFAAVGNAVGRRTQDDE